MPMHRTQTSMIDDEFGSVRERFEREMQRMEDEMNTFRGKMLDREREFFRNTSNFHSNVSSNTAAGSGFNNNQLQERFSSSQASNVFQNTGSSSAAAGGDFWNSLDSPLVQDTSDGKKLKLRFDVTQYAPEEIVVKTVDNKLQVQAKHEENSENRSVFREYKREFLLPPGVNPELIQSTLSKDGVLTVEAPLLSIEDNRERKIPIGHR